MSEHLTPAEVDLFLIDALDAARRARLEPHVGACTACLRLLQSGARMELAFTEVAKARHAPVNRVGFAAASAMALAASLLVFVHSPVTSGASHILASRACADVADASADGSTCATVADSSTTYLNGDD